VTPINEVRKNEGSYITEKVKQLREQYKSDDQKDFFKEYDTRGEETQSGESAPMPWEKNNDTKGDLPPGFIE